MSEHINGSVLAYSKCLVGLPASMTGPPASAKAHGALRASRAPRVLSGRESSRHRDAMCGAPFPVETGAVASGERVLRVLRRHQAPAEHPAEHGLAHSSAGL